MTFSRRTAEDLLQELHAVDESHRIEAKRASQIDRSILDTVCAFANEPGMGGGWLLLGVARDAQDLFDNAYAVVGVESPDQLQSDLASQCASAFNRPLRPVVSVESVQGKTVVVVYVPEAAPTDKPIFLTRLGLPRGAFRRIGPTDQEGTDDDLIALYAGHQQDTFDGAVLSDTAMADLDPAAIAGYRDQRRRANPDAEELAWTDPELLRALGCARVEGSELRPTVAGLLLFGTVAALRRCFPMMRIDYIRVPGRQWVEDPGHRFDTMEIRAPPADGHPPRHQCRARRVDAVLLAARRRAGARGRAGTAAARDPRGGGQRGDAPQLPHPRGGADHPLRQPAGGAQPRPLHQG